MIITFFISLDQLSAVKALGVRKRSYLVVSSRVVALLWLNLEAKSVTIKLVVLNLQEDRVSSGDCLKFWMNFVVRVRHHSEVETVRVPSVCRVITLSHENVHFSWGIN